MISRDEQRAIAVDHLADHLLRHGLAKASLRQLAAAAGVSDRMLLYYFDDKSDALTAAMERIATQLPVQLAMAIPEGTTMPAARLVAVAAKLTTQTHLRPYMRLWIEVVAAAARGEDPFVTVAQSMASGFTQWIETRLEAGDGADLQDRRALAAAVLAVVDGLALLDVCAGEALTRSAARSIGEVLTEPDAPA